MTVDTKFIAEETLWDFLLDLRQLVKQHAQKIQFISVTFISGQHRILFNENDESIETDKLLIISKDDFLTHKKSVFFQIDGNYYPRLMRNDWMAPENLAFLLLYLPFCFFSLKAFEMRCAVSLLHLAQSLDGKIAANNGNSKWIGNQENLVHSHRLRALFDGILIGSRTLKIDKPRLSVRLVKGPDPVKIVVGNSPCVFDSLLEANGQVIFISSQELPENEKIKNIIIPNGSGYIHSKAILTALYERGIDSLFIEGGAVTASRFIADHSVNFLQLFISPRILGSGISCFNLNEITQIDDSIIIASPTYKPMGNGILFSGEIQTKAS